MTDDRDEHAALTDRGADADRLDDTGQSPLSGALSEGEPEVVRTFVFRQTALLEPRDEP